MIERNFFGPGAALHHVGLAVRSIRDTCAECEATLEPSQRVHLAFVSLNGLTVELVEPAGENSPVAKILQGGGKLLHLCFVVPDLEAALRHCRQEGFHRISAPQRVGVFDQRRIAWVFSKYYGLFELLEQENQEQAAL